MKECDIVKIKNLNLEGMIITKGVDIETKKEKFQIYIDENNTYFCSEEDLIFVGTLDDEIEEIKLENMSIGVA